MFDFFECVKDMRSFPSVSGGERAAHEYFLKLSRKYFDNVYTDRIGNIICEIHSAKKGVPTLLVDAHLDEIGLTVSEITKDGFIKFSNVGGVDARTLPASKVRIFGKREIRGVISSKPPHVLSESERGKAPKIQDLFIDTGLPAAEINENISIGDLIVADEDAVMLSHGRFLSRSLDDRLCVLCIIAAAERLKGRDLNYNFTAVFSVCEELSSVGIKAAIREIKPDLAIAVDVTHAYTSGDKTAAVFMDGGAVISYSDTLSRRMSAALIKAADGRAQIAAEPGYTGTNAHYMEISEEHVPTGLISLPIRYMHTQSEMASLSDCEGVADLLVSFIQNGEFEGQKEEIDA